jgi:hypothetical protein
MELLPAGGDGELVFVLVLAVVLVLVLESELAAWLIT